MAKFGAEHCDTYSSVRCISVVGSAEPGTSKGDFDSSAECDVYVSPPFYGAGYSSGSDAYDTEDPGDSVGHVLGCLCSDCPGSRPSRSD